ncbi:MAG: YIP1 family protein [Spirochaetales bacterium]|nr:YIP1 family protein [Spirochaetales bacterium]
MFGETVKNLGVILYNPSAVLESPRYSRTSPATLLLLFFVLSLATGLLSYRVTSYEGVKEFQVEMGVKQAMKMMPGSTAEQEDELREQIRNQMYSPVAVISGYVSLIVGTLFSVAASILLFWFYMITAARFAGGEEEPVTVMKKKGEKVKKHRNSFILSAYRYVPLILSGLISVLLLYTKSKESFYNIATMEELTRKMTINVTVYGLLFEGSLPVNWESILNVLTSPFWWWSGWISVEGMKRKLNIPVKKGVVIFLIWVVIYLLFQLALLTFLSGITG